MLVIAVCGFAIWWSIRTARADWLASAGTAEGFAKARLLTPGDPNLETRAALDHSDSGDPSPAVDEELRRAARMNPFNSSVLMTLGLREEFGGENAGAEEDLVRAAAVDHQFKPAWTLANYYYRTNQPDKAWPMIERILHLDPLGYDPSPVFDLAWKLAKNDAASRKIQSLIPPQGPRPVEYLRFLMQTKRTDEALAFWPEALAATNGADAAGFGMLTAFPDFLLRTDRVPDAVRVWNGLVDRGILASGRLDPAKGESLADPQFRHPPGAGAFGWRVTDVPGVFTSGFSGSVRMEISGDEPQSFQNLSARAAVLPSARYRLSWKIDATALSAPADPGFRFEIFRGQEQDPIECPPLLASGTGCEFETGGETREVRLDLRYTRATGTTRVSGVLQLLSVRLEPAR